MKKQLTVLLTIFLILTGSVSAITTTQTQIQSRGDTLYVGGLGPGNYTTIQDAIDNATNADTVFVYNDSSPYYENLQVGKSIRLIGEKNSDVIIDGFGTKNTAITISANNCVLEGFTVINTSVEQVTYAGIRITSNNNLLRNNTISFHANGVWVEDSDENRFYGNYFSRNIFGVSLTNSCGNEISNNSYMDNPYGIVTQTKSDYNIFSYNTFNGNGISLHGSSYNEITMNNITYNSIDPFLGAFGINLVLSHHNIIRENTISNYDGIGVAFDLSGDNQVIRNNIIHNGLFGVYLYRLSRKNSIKQNNFIDNGYRTDLPVHYLDDTFFFNCIFNQWEGNYWDDWPYRLPRMIKGRFGIIGLMPLRNIDWHPAQEPYKIGE